MGGVPLEKPEIGDLIAAEIKKIPHGNLLPAGVVLVGGGSNLTGLHSFTKDQLRLAVHQGKGSGNHIIEGARDKLPDPAFATALGLVIWGFEKEFSGKTRGSSGIFVKDSTKKITKWFKNFLP